MYTNRYNAPVNTTQNSEEKYGEVVSFRLAGADLATFLKSLDMLKVSRSALGREAFREGFHLAIQKIIEKRKHESERLQKLERAKGFEPSTFTLAK